MSSLILDTSASRSIGDKPVLDLSKGRLINLEVDTLLSLYTGYWTAFLKAEKQCFEKGLDLMPDAAQEIVDKAFAKCTRMVDFRNRAVVIHFVERVVDFNWKQAFADGLFLDYRPEFEKLEVLRKNELEADEWVDAIVEKLETGFVPPSVITIFDTQEALAEADTSATPSTENLNQSSDQIITDSESKSILLADINGKPVKTANGKLGIIEGIDFDDLSYTNADLNLSLSHPNALTIQPNQRLAVDLGDSIECYALNQLTVLQLPLRKSKNDTLSLKQIEDIGIDLFSPVIKIKHTLSAEAIQTILSLAPNAQIIEQSEVKLDLILPTEQWLNLAFNLIKQPLPDVSFKLNKEIYKHHVLVTFFNTHHESIALSQDVKPFKPLEIESLQLSEDERRQQKLKAAILMELRDAGGVMTALELFKRIMSRFFDKGDPLKTCLEAGFAPHDVIRMTGATTCH